MKSLLEQMQILPPWNDDVKFEYFITSYFNDMESTHSYDRFGRSGQKQFGLDVYSIEKKTVIQCKLKLIRGGNNERIRKELIEELNNDFNSFLAYNKGNKLAYNKFIFASTFYSDSHIANECLKRSTDTITVEYWSWERIQNNIPEKVFKTYYSEFSGFLEEFYQKDNLPNLNNTEYIQDTNTIDFILKDNHPSKNQANFIAKLMNSDSDYRRYFYTRVDNPNWFHILKNKEEFCHSKIPLPIKLKDRFQIPFWEPLIYLEKISMEIKSGNLTEFSDEILNIIKAISENPRDNYHTWFIFIKILSNLPNDKITTEILNYIPIWLSGKFDNTIQSSEICQNLLPKFLGKNPTIEDIEKTELIIKHLLSLEKGEFLKKWPTETHESYRSRAHLHYLKDTFIEKTNLERITKYCSSHIIYQLLENIKKLRFDFPNGINIKIRSESNEYDIKTEISNSDLLVNLINDSHIISTSTISDFEKLGKHDIKEKYNQILIGNKITFIESEDNDFNFENLINALFNGSYYSLSDNPISKLDDGYHNGEGLNEVFSIILRDLLNQLSKENPNKAISKLREISTNPKYRLPFFQRLILFVIGENWTSLRNIFLEIISENDPKKLFTDYHYQNDLYELLNKNQELFNENELIAIQHILKIGPQKEKDESDSFPNLWRLRWNSALRKLPMFSDEYLLLSRQLNVTYEYFENENKTHIKWGDSSPLSKEEILKLKCIDIVNLIHSFKPKDRWEEPTISGLSISIGQAVEQNPLKFSEDIHQFKDVYYIYIYHIINGFHEAWRSKRTFNWGKVLKFLSIYINSEKFKNGQLSLENDSWNATSDLIIGSTANLLSEGMQSDLNVFEKELLPFSKNILLDLVSRLDPKEDKKQSKMDYPTYSLNSTTGKVIKACIDYALRIARNNYTQDENVKWDNETKGLFESAFENNIIDFYILTGWYYRQFYFLDSNWILEKIKIYSKIDEKYWLAFIGGLTFSSSPLNKSIYDIFYQHYERLISNNFYNKNYFIQGAISHIVAFQFWGFESLKKPSLLKLLIDKNNVNSILELVNNISQHEKYFQELKTKDEVKILEDKILEIWILLANKYENSETEEAQKVLSSLSNFLSLFSTLDETVSNLVLKSIKNLKTNYQYHNFLEILYNKREKGNPIDMAKYIAIILNNIQFSNYFSSNDKDLIIDLVSFLYKNNQKSIANEFCNKMMKLGNDFLRDIFNENQ
ncbi:MAG: hypothetical protein Q8R57_09320 [Bacteroidota bacterium]|nr:hypothetical protein [Bacteroidota bacterium]